jgi:hypothetical protein
MTRQAYRYQFGKPASLREAVEVLSTAILAATGLFGHARVRMDVRFSTDETINVIVIEAGTVAGVAVNLIFTALLAGKFGHEAFNVARVETIGVLLEATSDR